jgi:hypothetical protein
MRDRQECIGCGTLSPETETNYTLISAQFGWRLVRERLPDGTFRVEWRCPDCWKRYKQGRQATDDARAAARLSSGRSQASPPSAPRSAPSR